MDPKAFLQYLLQQRVLSRHQLHQSLSLSAQTKKSLITTLVQLGYATPETLQNALRDFKQRHSETKILTVIETDSWKPEKISETQFLTKMDTHTWGPEESHLMERFDVESEKILEEIGQISKGELLTGTLKLEVLPEETSFSENATDSTSIEENSSSALGRYEILETLGEGGMGVVQRVVDRFLGRELALKRIRLKEKEWDTSQSFSYHTLLWRLLQEASIMAQLEHPNIVPLYDIEFEKEGQLYFTMKRIEGQSLHQFLKKLQAQKSPIEEETLLSLFFKICEAVSYAHSKGVIHRDLKPENIMIGAFGEVYVMDWGISKMSGTSENEVLQGGLSSALLASPDICQTIGGIGTPGYMAPEQARDANLVQPQADIYSLGKILRQCYVFLSPAEELKKEIHTARRQRKLTKYHLELKDNHKLEEKIPSDIQAIIQKATSSDWQKRYSSVSEMVQDVERYQKNFQVSVRNYNTLESILKWGKRQKKWLIVFFVLVLIFSFGGLYWEWLSKKFQQEQFQKAYQLAQQRKQEALQFSKEVPFDEKLTTLLNALNAVNQALLFQPDSLSAFKEKTEISSTLVKMTCQKQDYVLAQYVAYDVQGKTPQEKTLQKTLLEQIQHAQNEKITQHRQRLHFWLKELQEKDIEEETREGAIFELSQMRELEIVQEILPLIPQATAYFLQNRQHASRKNVFYLTFVTVLGRQGHYHSVPILLEALQTMSKTIAPLENKSVAAIEYMIVLTFALANLNDPSILPKLQEVRTEMGEQSFFTRQTESLYQQILQRKNYSPK